MGLKCGLYFLYVQYTEQYTWNLYPVFQQNDSFKHSEDLYAEEKNHPLYTVIIVPTLEVQITT